MPVTVTVVEAVPLSEILLLDVLHVPPVVASLSVIEDPAHTVAEPVITAGEASTVNTDVALQPDAV
jgi:hypothetical protein